MVSKSNGDELVKKIENGIYFETCVEIFTNPIRMCRHFINFVHKSQGIL